MIRIPEQLLPYVDFDEGEILARELPQELESDFDNLKKLYESTKETGNLTDY